MLCCWIPLAEQSAATIPMFEITPFFSYDGKLHQPRSSPQQQLRR
jgi:hypothetical protein